MTPRGHVPAFAVVSAALLACEPVAPARAPSAPPPEEDASWLRSEKVDADVQELVVRAVGRDVRFRFEVRVRAPLDALTRARFAERGVAVEDTDDPRVQVVAASPDALALVVSDERVRGVTCAPFAAGAPAPPASDAWRAKVDRDVRAVVAASSACWFEVAIRFTHEPSDEDRAWFAAVGARIHAWSGDGAIAWVPVRAIPAVAALEVVAFVEPAPPLASP